MSPERCAFGTSDNGTSHRVDPCHLLRGASEGLWTIDQAGNGTWPVLHVATAFGNDFGSHPASPHNQPERGFRGSSVSLAVRTSRDRGPLPPRTEGQVGEGHQQRTRVVSEPRGGFHRKGFRRGRAEGVEGEASCLTSSSRPGREGRDAFRGHVIQRPEAEEEQGARQEEGEEAQEGKGEGGERESKASKEKGQVGWEASHSSSSQGRGDFVCWDRSGSRGEDQVKSGAQGQTLHEEQPKGKELFKPFIRVQGQQQQQSSGHSFAGWGLHRDLQGQEYRGEVPGSAQSRSYQDYEGQVVERSRRGDGIDGDPPHSTPVLQTTSGKEALSPGCPGDGHTQYEHRSSPEGETGTCPRHHVPANEIGGSDFMEIPPMENTLIVQPTELKEAQKDTYAESKATWLASLPNGGKGRGLGKGPKGDPKGKGDGKKDGKDGARTKGKEDRKESK